MWNKFEYLYGVALASIAIWYVMPVLMRLYEAHQIITTVLKA